MQQQLYLRISPIPIQSPFNSSIFHKPSLLSSSTCIFPPIMNSPDFRNRLLPIRATMQGNPTPNGAGHLHHQNDVVEAGGGFKEWLKTVSFMKWRFQDIKRYPVPCFFALSTAFFMGVEYTLRMIPYNSPPLDIGFIITRLLHRFIAARPPLNTVLAAFNTAFVGMQIAYISWALLIEGRGRAGIAAMFMFTGRGILGYSTQLPLPKDYLGSGADFPVGNVSFFLFYSGHVASAVIASLDMRRMQRRKLAWAFDLLNVLQVVRLLATRGHYTIDLGVGLGAGILFDFLAGKYEDTKADEGHV